MGSFPGYTIGIDWGKEICEEAAACGCNEPIDHAYNSYHAAFYRLRREVRAVGREFIKLLPKRLQELFLPTAA